MRYDRLSPRAGLLLRERLRLGLGLAALPLRDSFGAGDLDLLYDRERDLGDGERCCDRGEPASCGGMGFAEVVECDLVRDLPREGDLEAILRRNMRLDSSASVNNNHQDYVGPLVWYLENSG